MYSAALYAICIPLNVYCVRESIVCALRMEAICAGGCFYNHRPATWLYTTLVDFGSALCSRYLEPLRDFATIKSAFFLCMVAVKENYIDVKQPAIESYKHSECVRLRISFSLENFQWEMDQLCNSCC